MENKDIKCKLCGAEESPYEYINANEMYERQLCFECNFWTNIIEQDKQRKKYTWAIINGAHYMLEPHTDSYFKGFGGAKTRITFFDGTVKECDNLWCQGDISKHFRDKMPDNATIEWL